MDLRMVAEMLSHRSGGPAINAQMAILAISPTELLPNGRDEASCAVTSDHANAGTKNMAVCKKTVR